MNRMTVFSHAKINLGLHLVHRRPDGYHDIATIFQAISLHDIITFEKQEKGVTIRSDNAFLPCDQNNLVHRAVRVYEQTAELSAGLSVHIKKRIPMGAGLGGGSSNAAAALLALNRLYQSPLERKQLFEAALEIGSDVPFFLQGGTALGEGRGEILTPLHWSDKYWTVLLFPPFQVSTKWAYEQSKIALTKTENFTTFKALLSKSEVHSLVKYLRNDLEPAVFEKYPQLRKMKDDLYHLDAFYAGMSGSGSTVFGLFDTREQAVAAEMFFSIRDDITVFLCQPISGALEVGQ